MIIHNNARTILSLAFVALTTILIYTGRPLITAAAPFGIVSLQLAGDAVRAGAILESWGIDGRRAARINLAIDFPYLLVYAWLLALLCMRAADRTMARTRSFGRFLGRCVWLAGICDAAENIALLHELEIGPTTPIASFAGFAASTKFAILAFVIGYLLYAEIKSVRAR